VHVHLVGGCPRSGCAGPAAGALRVASDATPAWAHITPGSQPHPRARPPPQAMPYPEIEIKPPTAPPPPGWVVVRYDILPVQEGCSCDLSLMGILWVVIVVVSAPPAPPCCCGRTSAWIAARARHGCRGCLAAQTTVVQSQQQQQPQPH